MKVCTLRHLLIAIGPTSVAAVHTGHTDLELADVLLVEGSDIAALAILRTTGFFDRNLVVVLFDARDESLWPTTAAVMAFVRELATSPPWLVCAGPSPQLARLAAHVGACVIDPADVDPLTVALLPIACCARPGLVGFDAIELAAIARAGRVGRALTLPFRCDVSATDCLVALRCGPTVELLEINDTCTAIAGALADAMLLVAAPVYESNVPLQVDIIAW